MDDRGAAIFLPQPVVGRRRIEEQHATCLAGVRGLEQRVGGKIRDDQKNTLVGQPRHRCRRIGVGREAVVDE